MTYRPDRWLACLCLALTGLGLVMLASASQIRGVVRMGDAEFYLYRQCMWLAVGVVALLLAACIDYRLWRTFAWPLWAGSVLLLVLVLVFGRKIGGSQRWLFGFQPSELAKFATVAFLARWISQHPFRQKRLRVGVILPGLAVGLILVLILMEPDLGTAVLLVAVSAAMLFVGGSSIRHLVVAATLVGLCLFVFLRLDPVRWGRVQAHFHPEDHPNVALQALQSKAAFVQGGTSIDLGGGMQKRFYLPEIHTDFVFANVGEELGLAGSLGTATLFLGLFLCGLVISLRAPDQFGSLFAFGLVAMITIQAFFNMLVVTGLLPTKGITLPFFSYGGSSLVITLLECGILMRIARQTPDRLDE